MTKDEEIVMVKEELEKLKKLPKLLEEREKPLVRPSREGSF
jgi:hypothetical protein